MGNKKIKTVEDKGRVGVKGIHTLNFCCARYPEARELMAKLDGFGPKRQWLMNRMAHFIFDKKAKGLHEEAHMATLGLEEALKAMYEEFQYFNKKLLNKFLIRQQVVKNVTCNAGRNVVARRFAGNTTYSGIVNYCALGDDNTAAAITDATLGNETFRKALSAGTFSAQTAYLETFFTYTDVNGTFEEFGFFIDGTGSADTGQLLNRFTQNVTKTALESLNVQSQIALTDI